MAPACAPCASLSLTKVKDTGFSLWQIGESRELSAKGAGMDQEISQRSAPGWSAGRLAVLLYVFAAAAVAINLFMLGLLMQALGFTALPPVTALLAAVPLGVPAAWAAGRWVRHLLDEADQKPSV